MERSAGAAPLLIGRDRELASFEGLLERGGPALILVRGPPGIGKTSFLQAVGALADGLGWEVVRSDGASKVDVAPATTRDSFSQRLRAALGIPEHEALAPAEGDFESDAGRLVHPLAPGAYPPPRGPGPPRDPLVEQLRRRRGRVLVLVDGYAPLPAFAAWFRNVFVAELMRHRVQVVVAVTDAAEPLAALQPAARDCIDLELLPANAVLRHFESLALHANPPLDDAETEAFARESVARPELLSALHHLLTLPCRTTPEPGMGWP